MFVRKRKERRIRKKSEGTYTFWDAVGDVLIWIPELIVLPFRILWYLIRGIGSIFDWT
ncbi:hypothetical protein ACQCVK_12730 [Rossellomorea vietnamensis]|uniref:hypothetical protein n=1 Tax=Rossellomorea vietnamensis TaxID=218284 RepID=UPI001653863F|nr:hypothetical protein [Rossellomorea vietnamensis]